VGLGGEAVTDILTTTSTTFHSAALGEDLTVAVEREEIYVVVAHIYTEEEARQIITNAITNWARTIDEFGRQFAAAWKAMQPAVDDISAAIAALLAADAARRARLRRMHHLYRMRRR
jgi:hypothetical protein